MLINFVRGKLNYFYILPIQKNTSKSLSYERAIREYAAKKCFKKVVQ